jgi:hypothetical protein
MPRAFAYLVLFQTVFPLNYRGVIQSPTSSRRIGQDGRSRTDALRFPKAALLPLSYILKLATLRGIEPRPARRQRATLPLSYRAVVSIAGLEPA